METATWWLARFPLLVHLLWRNTHGPLWPSFSWRHSTNCATWLHQVYIGQTNCSISRSTHPFVHPSLLFLLSVCQVSCPFLSSPVCWRTSFLLAWAATLCLSLGSISMKHRYLSRSHISQTKNTELRVKNKMKVVLKCNICTTKIFFLIRGYLSYWHT